MSKEALSKRHTKTRIPIVNMDRCQPATCGHNCIKYCPLNKKTKVIYADKVTKKARINSKKCIACGICVNRCPTHAIAMVGLPVSELYSKEKNQLPFFSITEVQTPV